MASVGCRSPSLIWQALYYHPLSHLLTPTPVLTLHEAGSEQLPIPLSLSLNLLSVFQFAPDSCLLISSSLLSLLVHLSPRHKVISEVLCLMMGVITSLDP